MNTARRLGCRFLGLTLCTVGLRNTRRPVHRRGGLCSSRARSPCRGYWEIIQGSVLVDDLSCGHAWIDWRKRRHSGHRSTRLAACSSRGPARWVGRRRWRLSRRCHHPQERSSWFSRSSFSEGVNYVFLENVVSGCFELLNILVNVKPHFSSSPLLHLAYMSFWLSNGLFSFSGDALHW